MLIVFSSTARLCRGGPASADYLCIVDAAPVGVNIEKCRDFFQKGLYKPETMGYNILRFEAVGTCSGKGLMNGLVAQLGERSVRIHSEIHPTQISIPRFSIRFVGIPPEN